MNLKKLFFLLLLLSGLASAQTVQLRKGTLQNGTIGPSATSACGPPGYNCSTSNSSAVVALPTTLPFSGYLGAGTLVSAPEPGNPGGIDNSPICRLSDENFPFQNSADTMSPNSSGNGFSLTFNSNRTFMYTADAGANTYLWSLTPSASNQCAGAVNTAHLTNVGTEPAFSTITPNKYYFGNKTQGTCSTAFSCLSHSDPTDNTHAVVTDFDFATCNGYNATLAAGGISDPPLMEYGDTMFSTGFSFTGQDSGRLEVAYVPGTGCFLINSSTMQMYGPSGLIGFYNVSHGTFKIHQVAQARGPYVNIAIASNAAIDKFPFTGLTGCTGTCSITYAALSDGTQIITGESMIITGTTSCDGTFTITSANSTSASWAETCTIGATTGTATVNNDNGSDPFQWAPGATDLGINCSQINGHCSGHYVGGATHFFNDYNNTVFAAKELATPGVVDFTFPQVDPCAANQIPWDTHPNIVPAASDTGLMVMFGSTPGNTAPDYTKPCTAELMGILASGSTTNEKRFGHCYRSSFGGTWQFDTNECIVAFSQDGALVSLGSNMSNGLGDTEVTGPVSAAEVSTTVTLTASGTWSSHYTNGGQISVAGCSVNGYNGQFTIGTVSGTTLTYTASVSGLGAATSCATCVPGSVGNGPHNGTGGTCRADVFLVDLRGQ